jgi:hypothetical protein
MPMNFYRRLKDAVCNTVESFAFHLAPRPVMDATLKPGAAVVAIGRERLSRHHTRRHLAKLVSINTDELVAKKGQEIALSGSVPVPRRCHKRHTPVLDALKPSNRTVTPNISKLKQ